MRPAVLLIAGSDSSGGAGLIRDLQVLSQHGVDALCAVTAVTAQTDSHTGSIHHVPPQVVREQIAAARHTRPIGAIKIGMLGTRATVEAIASGLAGVTAPIVLDPVLRASSGGELLDEVGRQTMCAQLFPLAALVTPNIPEAALLLQSDPADNITAMIEQAKRLLRMGPGAVLLKGGHATGSHAVDVLVRNDNEPLLLTSPRTHVNRRGTGCALASAIAAALASGASLDTACQRAKRYIADELQPPRNRDTAPMLPFS